MKPISQMIPHFIVAALLAISSLTMASDSPGQNTDEAARIIEAMELYATATPLDQQNPERGKLLKRAESILKDVIKKNPESLDAHRKLMGVYLQMRDYRHAIETMQSAITLSPEDPKLFIALAILYDHSGAYEYALPILNEALALDADNKLAQDYKVSIQQKIDQQRLAMEPEKSPHGAGMLHSK